MANRKLTITNAVPAIHGSQELLDDDQTGAAASLERMRFERRMLDFEVAVRAERDRLHSEHLQNMRTILNGSDEEAAE